MPVSTDKPKRKTKKPDKFVPYEADILEVDEEEDKEAGATTTATSTATKPTTKQPSWIPMGQKPLSDTDITTAIREAKKELEPIKWEQMYPDILSFEAWCVATAYDPTKTDGGVQFQKMMQYILTDGGKVHSLNLQAMGYTPPEKMPNNSASKVTEAERYVYSKGKSAKVQYLHSPITQFVSKSAGAYTGSYSGKTRGFYYRTSKRCFR